MLVALVIQQWTRMRHIVVCGLFGCTVFFHIILKTVRFSKKKIIERKMCVLIFSRTSSETFLILTRNERAMIKDAYGTSCKVPVIRVVQLVEALCYKPAGRGFDSRFRPHCGPGVGSVCKRNKHQEYLLGRRGGRWLELTTLSPSCADCVKIWDPQPPGVLRACPSL